MPDRDTHSEEISTHETQTGRCRAVDVACVRDSGQTYGEQIARDRGRIGGVMPAPVSVGEGRRGRAGPGPTVETRRDARAGPESSAAQRRSGGGRRGREANGGPTQRALFGPGSAVDAREALALSLALGK